MKSFQQRKANPCNISWQKLVGRDPEKISSENPYICGVVWSLVSKNKTTFFDASSFGLFLACVCFGLNFKYAKVDCWKRPSLQDTRIFVSLWLAQEKMAEGDHPVPNSRSATWGSFSRVSPGTPCMLTTLPLIILTSYHHQQPTLLICNSVWNTFLGNMKSPSITALSLPIAMSTHDSVALTNKPKVEAIFATHCGLNGHENWKPKVPGTFFWEKKRYIIQLLNWSLTGCKL